MCSFFVVLQQILNGTAFIQNFCIKKVINGNSVPNLRASWILKYPACFSQLTITFIDENDNNRVLSQRVIEREDIAATTEIEQSMFTCNDRVKAEFSGTDGLLELVARSADTIYTGGEMHDTDYTYGVIM